MGRVGKRDTRRPSTHLLSRRTICADPPHLCIGAARSHLVCPHRSWPRRPAVRDTADADGNFLSRGQLLARTEDIYDAAIGATPWSTVGQKFAPSRTRPPRRRAGVLEAALDLPPKKYFHASGWDRIEGARGALNVSVRPAARPQIPPSHGKRNEKTKPSGDRMPSAR